MFSISACGTNFVVFGKFTRQVTALCNIQL